MAEEVVTINLQAGNDAFFADLDRRFAGIAQKFGSQLSRATGGAGGAPGGGGAGGGSGGGGGGSSGRSPALDAFLGASGLDKTLDLIKNPGVAAAHAIGAGIAGAGAGVAATPGGALNNSAAVLDRAETGFVGGVVKDIAGKIPILGDWVTAQWNRYEQDKYDPAQRATDRLKGYYGDLAARGINVSESRQEAAMQRAQAAEERRQKSNRHLENVGESVRVNRSSSYSVSLFG